MSLKFSNSDGLKARANHFKVQLARTRFVIKAEFTTDV